MGQTPKNTVHCRAGRGLFSSSALPREGSCLPLLVEEAERSLEQYFGQDWISPTPIGQAMARSRNARRQQMNQNFPRLLDALYPGQDGEHADALSPALIREVLGEELMQESLQGEDAAERLVHALSLRFPRERTRALILNNPCYPDLSGHLQHVQESQRRRQEHQRLVQEALQTRLPRRLVDLYPLARAMHRRFVLHIGPTNSGKTHDALQALARAHSGICLSPLRLLAYEQYDTLCQEGVHCSLLTGEEHISDPQASVISCTVEMADLSRHYDIALIDEAQMIADPDRGGAWSAAILGLPAQEIHVCAAPEAQERLQEMIASCGDTCEVVRHERRTPLVLEKRLFHLDGGVREGDALIVFSRRQVHAVAGLLQRQGWTCSVLYGALPYEVRHRQASEFARGRTQIVVSTDCIGMGMNLPIRRIVFLENEKFDGTCVRPLLPTEIRQIAGRAGRYGIFDEGRVACVRDRDDFAQALAAPPEPIREAVVRFPRSLLSLDEPLSQILTLWSEDRKSVV